MLSCSWCVVAVLWGCGKRDAKSKKHRESAIQANRILELPAGNQKKTKYVRTIRNYDKQNLVPAGLEIINGVVLIDVFDRFIFASPAPAIFDKKNTSIGKLIHQFNRDQIWHIKSVY